MVSITFRLLALPERGWPRLSARLDQEEPLPAPWRYTCAFGAGVAACTFLGGLLAPSLSFAQALGHSLIALVGYCTAPALAHWRFSSSPISPALPARYQDHFIAAATLPVIGSGIFNLFPIPTLTILWTLVGALGVSWSAYIGASKLLGLAGPARKRVAIELGCFSVITPMAANILRITTLG